MYERSFALFDAYKHFQNTDLKGNSVFANKYALFPQVSDAFIQSMESE